MDEQSLLGRITVEPGKVGGKPCIRGHRFKVADLLDMIAAGVPWCEIEEDFPFLGWDDVRAATLYASRFLRQHDHAA